jgi:hypothetical protein
MERKKKQQGDKKSPAGAKWNGTLRTSKFLEWSLALAGALAHISQ